MKQKKRQDDDADEPQTGKKKKQKVKSPSKRREKYKGTYRGATEMNVIRKVKRMLKSCGPEATRRECDRVHPPRNNAKGKNIKSLPYMGIPHLKELAEENTKAGDLARKALAIKK